jgi:hypothetical protein
MSRRVAAPAAPCLCGLMNFPRVAGHLVRTESARHSGEPTHGVSSREVAGLVRLESAQFTSWAECARNA